MTGWVWVASYVLLWIAVLVLAFAVVVLLRQIGVLHARMRPMGVHFAGEGLEEGVPAPTMDRFDFSRSRLTLLAFTSPTCQICAALLPSLRVLARDYTDVTLEIIEGDAGSAAVFRAYNVSNTPYVIAVGRDGAVLGGGVANNLEQVEELIETVSGAAA